MSKKVAFFLKKLFHLMNLSSIAPKIFYSIATWPPIGIDGILRGKVHTGQRVFSGKGGWYDGKRGVPLYWTGSPEVFHSLPVRDRVEAGIQAGADADQ